MQTGSSHSARLVTKGYIVADAVQALTLTNSPQPVMSAYLLSSTGSSQAKALSLALLEKSDAM